MSKVTRDGMVRDLGADMDSEARSDLDAEPTSTSTSTSATTPPPRKRLDLNATITLSEEALAALLEEVKSGRGTPSLEEDVPAPSSLAAQPPAPAVAIVPESWKRPPAQAKRKF